KNQFLASAALHDTVDGKVVDCGQPNTGAAFSFNLSTSNKIALSTTITRKQPLMGKLSLVKEGSAWKIDTIDPSLQGTDLSGFFTGQAFCAALVASNYHSAYGLLSHTYQTRSSEQDFTNRMKSTFSGNLKLTDCKLDSQTYTVTGSTGKINTTFVV